MRSTTFGFAALALALVACATAEEVGSSGTGGTCAGAACDGSAGSASVCVPGKQEACACPGGAEGAQECRNDGSGYYDCQCGGSGGSSGSGGASGASGASGAGGAGGSAGAAGAGGVGCPSGQKSCAGACVLIGPSTGCESISCLACPIPNNGTPACVGGQCDFSCNTGYQKSGTSCVPTGSGGTGGAGGSGGGSGVCNPISPTSSAGGYTPCAAGESCVPSPTGTTSCAPGGSKGFHQPCSSQAECAPGLTCAKEFIGGNHCIHYCLNTADCTGTYLCAGSFNPPLYAGSQQLNYCL